MSLKNEIIPQYVTDLKETGIIAPYKEQVRQLEKETIITLTGDNIISDFADAPYLINVAVSRAKRKLMVVVTGNEQTKEYRVKFLSAD